MVKGEIVKSLEPEVLPLHSVACLTLPVADNVRCVASAALKGGGVNLHRPINNIYLHGLGSLQGWELAACRYDAEEEHLILNLSPQAQQA